MENKQGGCGVAAPAMWGNRGTPSWLTQWGTVGKGHLTSLKGAVGGERTPLPPWIFLEKKKKKIFFFSCCFLEQCNVKQSFLSLSAKAIHYGKICSPVTSRDKSGSWQTGALGSKRVTHRRLHTERSEGSVKVWEHLPLNL